MRNVPIVSCGSIFLKSAVSLTRSRIMLNKDWQSAFQKSEMRDWIRVNRIRAEKKKAVNSFRSHHYPACYDFASDRKISIIDDTRPIVSLLI
jgi:hypothetical protein